MHKVQKIITYPDYEPANERLQAIGAGLSIELLKSVATSAVTHASQITRNNANNAYGVYLYHNFIKSLRDQLKFMDGAKVASIIEKQQ